MTPTILYPPNNLSHIYNRHAITRTQIDSIIASPDIISATGSNIKQYYMGDFVVIITRDNKNGKWKLKTAYKNDKPFIMGKIIYSKED